MGTVTPSLRVTRRYWRTRTEDYFNRLLQGDGMNVGGRPFRLTSRSQFNGEGSV